MAESARRLAVVLVVVAAVAGGGYLAVTKVGWESTLRFLGFDITTFLNAPNSQCQRAREQQNSPGRDKAIACIADRRWGRQYVSACAKRADPGLVAVGADGVLIEIPKCPAAESAQARAHLHDPIPKDYRVADQVESTRK